MPFAPNVKHTFFYFETIVSGSFYGLSDNRLLLLTTLATIVRLSLRPLNNRQWLLLHRLLNRRDRFCRVYNLRRQGITHMSSGFRAGPTVAAAIFPTEKTSSITSFTWSLVIESSFLIRSLKSNSLSRKIRYLP